MSLELTVCGCNCTECPQLGTQCNGCNAICGKVYWAAYIGTDICPIYKCVGEKKLGDCGECAELPCKIWIDMKDPEWTDEQHQESIRVRVKALRDK